MLSEWRRKEQVGSRGQGGTLPDKAVTPFNTSSAPVISSSVCVWTFGLSWHRQHYHSYLPPPKFYLSHTSSSQHSADFTLKLVDLGGRPTLTPPCDSLIPPSPQHDPAPAPEYWPKLSPWPAPLTPLGVEGCVAGPKVQMIFPHLPPSCWPSELIANDNIRKGHNGDSTNNLPLGFANLNICRIYKWVMNDCLLRL